MTLLDVMSRDQLKKLVSVHVVVLFGNMLENALVIYGRMINSVLGKDIRCLG
jgi:hypothetical protein